jgi:hypothetical protein
MLARKSLSVYSSPSNPDAERVLVPELMGRSPGPEGPDLRQQAVCFVRREVKKIKPSLDSVVNHHYGSKRSLEKAAKVQRRPVGRSKVSSFERTGQAAFFA